MFGVPRELLQGLGGRLEQEVVEEALVDPNQRIEPMREGEDDVEVGNGQQQGLLGCEPFGPGAALALGAVAIATGVVTEPFRAAPLTHFDMAAESSRAALRNRPQHPCLLVRDGVRRAKCRAIRPHDVGHLKGRWGRMGGGAGRCRWRRQPRHGLPRCTTSGKLSSGDPGRPRDYAPRARSAWWS